MDIKNAASAHILLVDDEPGIAQHLSFILGKEGFRVTVAADGQVGLELVFTHRPDLVLLDISLPKLDGRLVLRRMRADGDQTPVIWLTGCYLSDADELVGLDMGADDFIRKPFVAEVVVSRIRAVLRRTRAGKLPLARCLKLNTGDRPLQLNRAAKRAYLHSRDLGLKPADFELLECLMLHPDEVMSRERILDSLSEKSHSSWIAEPRLVDRQIAPLRKALGDNSKPPAYIETVHSEGYRFIGPVEGEE